MKRIYKCKKEGFDVGRYINVIEKSPLMEGGEVYKFKYMEIPETLLKGKLGVMSEEINEFNQPDRHINYPDTILSYNIWGTNQKYCQSLLLSVISAMDKTDYRGFKSVLNVQTIDPERDQHIIDLFEPFFDYIYFTEEDRYKYSNPLNPVISQYEYAIQIDSDLFFWGELEYSIFEKLREIVVNSNQYNELIKRPVKERIHPDFVNMIEDIDDDIKNAPFVVYSDIMYYDVYARASMFHVVLRNTINFKWDDFVSNYMEFNSTDYKYPGKYFNDPWPWNTLYAYRVKDYHTELWKTIINDYYDVTREWWDEEYCYYIYHKMIGKPYLLLIEEQDKLFPDHVSVELPFCRKGLEHVSMREFKKEYCDSVFNMFGGYDDFLDSLINSNTEYLMNFLIPNYPTIQNIWIKPPDKKFFVLHPFDWPAEYLHQSGSVVSAFVLDH